MSGRVPAEDVAAVRQRVRIDEVIGEVVTLRPAGGGSLKGLCPFHDERSPSFHVTPARGLYYCFGCGEGGDVVDFLMKHDHLSFLESVERLAVRAGVTLRHDGERTRDRGTTRTRLTQANQMAATFFVECLSSRAEAEPARQFLTERGFDEHACARFGVGFAPRGWDSLLGHLRSGGFSDAEALAAGLVSQGQRGTFDRFRGRLMWPIREASGEVIGFGARRILDDDDGPKYLNTPETALYRKSSVLYGIDLARREIGAKRQVVVVEGYTDVMAAHVAGVETAVATCGTAFGSDHASILRRYLMDDDLFRGEVIFTFDGDAAGQRAALRAFELDQSFVAQTFVAVSPDGTDPCELRLARGDAAVRELVSSRTPLFEFAIRSQISGFNLATAEGRVAAMRRCAPIVARIRDTSLRPEYVRLLSGWVGLPEAEVRSAVSAAGGGPQRGPGNGQGERRRRQPGSRDAGSGPRPARGQAVSADRGGDRPGRGGTGPGGTGPGSSGGETTFVEREALKVALQVPGILADWYADVDEDCYTVPEHHLVHRAIAQASASASASTPATAGLEWIDTVLSACPDDSVRVLVRRLAVEPVRTLSEGDQRYASAIIARLLSDAAGRRILAMTREMSTLDAQVESAKVVEILRDIMELEAYRRELGRASQVDP